MARLRPPLVAVALCAAAAISCTCSRANAPATEARAAAETPAAATGDAAVLRSSAQCGASSREGAARWLATEEAYRAALEELDRGRLPGTAPRTRAVDFDTHGVLVVEMGRRATAGYTLELASDDVESDDGTGVLRVNWTEPPEGAMVAQVLTSPCLLVAVRKEGLHALKVVDQAGTTRQTVELE